MNLKYLFHRIINLNFQNIPKYVQRSHDKSGKSKIGIWFDMIGCALKYGAGYVDYTIFGMYNLDKNERKKILTRQKSNDYIAYLNPREHRHILKNKVEFLQHFDDLCRRDYLDLRQADDEQFIRFCMKHPQFVAKPDDGKCGEGIKIVDCGEYESPQALRHELEENYQTTLEQLIVQHEQVSKIYPNAINTVRMVTMTDDIGNAHIVFCCMRLGTGKSRVDNFNSGGITVLVNVSDGRLYGNAVNKAGDIFAAHPDSGVIFEDYQLPMWEQCTQLALNAAKSVEILRYVGWDVAITPDGPLIVEGNEFPGYDLYQLCGQVEHPQGMLEVFDKIVPYKNAAEYKK